MRLCAAAVALTLGLAPLMTPNLLPTGGPCSLTQGVAPRGAPSRIPFLNPAAGRTIAAPSPNPGSLHTVADIPLPGRAVRFDYQAEDPRTGRLYISHMHDAQVVVFDTHTRQVVGRVPGTPGVTGVGVLPEGGTLDASVTGRHYVAVIDTDSLIVRATPGPIGFPDGIADAPASGRVFVSDESGGGELVIDAATDRVVTRIGLGGEAGNTRFDPGSGCILVAVQTLNQVVAIDPATARVVGRYLPEGADHPHGMYVDAAGRLLFVANQGNATLEVIDLAAMRVTAVLPVGDDPDVLAFDPGWQRLYVASEGGGLWLYRVLGRALVPEGRLELPHAHTVSVDSASHLVYLPLQALEGRPVLRILEGSRPE